MEEKDDNEKGLVRDMVNASPCFDRVATTIDARGRAARRPH